MRRRAHWIVLVLMGACTGRFVGDPRGGGGTGGPPLTGGGAGGAGNSGGSAGTPAVPVCQPKSDPGPTPLMRLSTWQKADGTTLLSRPLGAGTGYTWAPLADLQTPTGISGILGPALNRFLPKLTLIRGLDFLPSVNHNYGGLLGNSSSCTKATPCDGDKLARIPTIDQVMAYSKKVYPEAPGLRCLNVSQGVTDAMSFSDLGIAGGAVQQLKARTNPLDAFNDVFAGAGTPGGDTGKQQRERCWSIAFTRTT